MEQRISLITLGVNDLPKAVQFYEQVVAWERKGEEPGVAFFDLGGLAFSLYPHAEMRKEWKADDDPLSSYHGFAIAHNVNSVDEVDAIFVRLAERGATILKAPEKVFWGGYSGYFCDIDGHAWEVAHNPFWTVMDDGRLSMTPQAANE